MEEDVNRLFERYQDLFCQAIQGNADVDQITSSYASAIIGATPSGVMASQNDELFKEALKKGFDHYRAIGTKDMRIRGIECAAEKDLVAFLKRL